jgi:hypothetical protein
LIRQKKGRKTLQDETYPPPLTISRTQWHAAHLSQANLPLGRVLSPSADHRTPAPHRFSLRRDSGGGSAPGRPQIKRPRPKFKSGAFFSPAAAPRTRVFSKLATAPLSVCLSCRVAVGGVRRTPLDLLPVMSERVIANSSRYDTRISSVQCGPCRIRCHFLGYIVTAPQPPHYIPHFIFVQLLRGMAR